MSEYIRKHNPKAYKQASERLRKLKMDEEEREKCFAELSHEELLDLFAEKTECDHYCPHDCWHTKEDINELRKEIIDRMYYGT